MFQPFLKRFWWNSYANQLSYIENFSNFSPVSCITNQNIFPFRFCMSFRCGPTCGSGVFATALGWEWGWISLKRHGSFACYFDTGSVNQKFRHFQRFSLLKHFHSSILRACSMDLFNSALSASRFQFEN